MLIGNSSLQRSPMSSLSSVVSNLVRAQMGTAISPQVTDDDLDKAVAELILKEAKKKAERFGQDGIRAYLRSGMSDSNAPRANKRFLTSIIRSTDDHNKTILQAQAQAAQELKRERDEAERRARRALAEEAVAAEKLRRSRGEGSSRRKTRLADGWDHWDGRTAERPKRKQRDWETWNGEDSDEDDRDRSHRSGRYRSRSRDRRRRRDDDRYSSSKRSKKERSTEGKSRRHRSDDKRSHRRRIESPSSSKPRRYALDSLSPTRSSTETDDSRPRKRRRSASRSRSRSPSRLEYRRSRDPSPAAPKYSDVTARELELRQKLKSARKDERPSKPSSPPRKSKRDRTRSPPSRERTETPEPPLKRAKPQPSSSRITRLPSRSPSRSPTPGPDPEIQLPSKMDKYFEESYDPRLDVAPLTVPKVPATGLINNAEFEGWDAMLELIRLRREDKEEKKMLERLGLTKEKVKSTGSKGPISSSAANDRWSGEGLNVMQIEYNKRGSVREWDMGKEGF
ncbi:hypothetical protein MSAN_02226300 [Mycena sanguinolenta]|uniref:Uncharacterized protein n=1 Tax=Mycena sanguinolenta TaxID=230812 RepID=A0A8H6XBJ9_9AGAR|nr:hypothetical protein MSAN_02226300 [Mycena sanguinolenta]